jgi:hypothetical protein
MSHPELVPARISAFVAVKFFPSSSPETQPRASPASCQASKYGFNFPAAGPSQVFKTDTGEEGAALFRFLADCENVEQRYKSIVHVVSYNPSEEATAAAARITEVRHGWHYSSRSCPSNGV